jgi:hypothetical protein
MILNASESVSESTYHLDYNMPKSSEITDRERTQKTSVNRKTQESIKTHFLSLKREKRELTTKKTSRSEIKAL